MGDERFGTREKRDLAYMSRVRDTLDEGEEQVGMGTKRDLRQVGEKRLGARGRNNWDGEKKESREHCKKKLGKNEK